MQCDEIRHQIMCALDEPDHRLPLPVTTHLVACTGCAAFARDHFALDRGLDALHGAVRLEDALRSRILVSVAAQEQRELSALLPDVVHVATCVAATTFCATTLPTPPGLVLAAGLFLTAASYVTLAIARAAFAALAPDEPTNIG